MANQGMMLPPNNAPWPGLQQPQTHSSLHQQPASTSTSHSTYSSTHPPPPPPHSPPYPSASYYHHPGHHHHPPPPPPHSSHQQPYYPYHPYPGGPYPPPYPPAHGASHPHPAHPGYHITHSHYPSSQLQPPAAQDTVSVVPGSTSSSSQAHPDSTPETLSGTTSGSRRLAQDPAKAKPIKTPEPATKTGKAGAEVPGKNASKASTAPKTFRFEGSISSETYKTTKSFDLAGVNILNRKPLDTRTALDKLQRRRETHNRVERKRRDCINQLVDDLTKLLPPKHLEEATSKCHRVNVLRGAVAHIKFLSETNAALSKVLDAAKDQGFTVPSSTELAVVSSSNSTDDSAPPKETNSDASEDLDTIKDKEQDMSMDVDVKQEEKDELEDDDDEEIARAEKTSSRSTSPSVSSKTSTSVSSPSLTPSRATTTQKHQWPPVIVTNAPSPSSDKESSLVPLPISIVTAPADPPGDESRSHDSKRSNSFGNNAKSPASSSFSNSPMLPASPYSATSASAFPPSPVSPSPSERQNPFSLQVSQAGESQGSTKDQQLSPFLQPRSAGTSPSLPPISSLANMQLQSPSGSFSDTGSASDRQGSPTLPSMTHQRASSDVSPSLTASSLSNSKYGHHHHSQRTGPTLPPLKIPGAQHLHPSHASNGSSNVSNGSSKTLSPHRSSEADQQPPVSPFMLSPMMSRSPSMGPSSSPSPSGSSPYPHWGHEPSESAAAPPPPPHHPGHYMPGAHVYPAGYPYPYPYHPSYAYPPPPGPHPHPHPLPPHHHHHHHHHPHQHSPPPPPSSSTTTPRQKPSPVASAVRPSPPEPIFIQEEPWIVQRKRSTSNANAGKNSSSSSAKQAQASKKASQTEKVIVVVEGETGSMTPSSTYPVSPNHRKRSSSSSDKGDYFDGMEDKIAASPATSQPFPGSTAKRAKSLTDQEMTEANIITTKAKADKGSQEPNESGIVVVVVGADGEVAKEKESPENVGA
ncbi:hypothetical protein BGX28_005022 [Mortierella sp. GBA30]|nr:hypothetical protein BGX28_005022 [Mortierella sp. GBA30]